MGLVSYAIEPHDHASNLKGGILSLDAAHPVPDTIEIVKGSADGTKRLRFEVDGLTTATTRVITMADLDINLTPGTGSYAAALSGLTDNRVIRADGATGLQQSAVTIDDSGNISGIGNITLTGSVISAGAIAIKPSGDTDDYLSLTTDTGVPTISVVGGNAIRFESDSANSVLFYLRDTLTGMYLFLGFNKTSQLGYIYCPSGPIDIQPSGDSDDYVRFQTTSNVPEITTVGSCNLKITASGGTIDFDNENLTTTGTVDGRDVSADGTTLDNHVANTSNPHSVTAAQVGNTTAQWNADKLQGYAVHTDAPTADGVLWWDTGNSRYFCNDIEIPLYRQGGRAPTKGELLAHSGGAGDYNYLAPGANGSFLIADDTQASGLKYDKTAPTGAIVGTTDTQTLSAKTLTTPTIGDFTNAGHDHSNAAGGGNLAAKLRTVTRAIQVESPEDEEEYIFAFCPYACTMVEVNHISSAGTINFNIEKRGKTTPLTAGTAIWTVDKGITTSSATETSFNSGSISADQVLAVTFDTPSSIGTVVITVEYTID